MPYKDPDKQRLFVRTWMADRRRAWLHANGPCKRCGSRQNLRVDHIDPKTKKSHKVWSWSEKRRLEELAKCQVLCLACHRKKTVENHENARGAQIGAAVLTVRKVREIRRRIAAGEMQNALATEFGVGKATIHRVVHRLTWRHVE